MLKTHRIIPLVFILFLFGLTLIPAPIVIAQQADDVVVECQPVTKTEALEVCREQMIAKEEIHEVCREQMIAKEEIHEVCREKPKTERNEQTGQMITKMERVCTKEPRTVTDQECTK